MPTDPTEHDARELLARAAVTIDVDDAAPLTLTGLPEPHPRRWPLLVAAAAAIVLVLGGGWLVAAQLGTDDAPPRPAGGPVAEHEHVYSDDQVPSLLGYTTAEARELLADREVAVKVAKTYSCSKPAGYVLGSDPAQGTTVRSGDQVTLDVTGGPPPRGVCNAVLRYRWSLVIDLIRFARGLDRPPPFAPSVRTFAGTGTATLTAGDAGDPDSWVVCDADACHSAVAALVEELTAPQYLRVGGPPPNRYLNPTIDLSNRASYPGSLAGTDPCGLSPDPSNVPGQVWRPTYLSFEAPMDGRPFSCPDLRIDWGPGESIAGVGLRLSTRPDPSPPPEVDPVRKQAAGAFVAWARGSAQVPDFADSVRYLVNDAPIAEFSADEASHQDSWSVCPRFMSAPCSNLPNPLSVIDADWHPVVQTRRAEPSDFCRRSPVDLPADLADRVADDMVELSQAEPKNCGDAYSVELWIDDAGRIDAVDLALIPRKGPLPKP